ncbi:hypothetical protein GS399_10005 [Pedobacter sp. HMF7647]|uniref:SbsA Ig-like domain-containing protein n=1 Tax=Hufsiella arboris TaxID=2695275 RepID=A0A7K1YAA4_9SPHI|nr:Ig-like domain-containing protein [Hufsiella arboris]MXV51301.1 hypothetical protein [Hufsiella arboris]
MSYNTSVTNSVNDKNGVGTGFTTINSSSASRMPVDGSPSIPSLPGYEPSRITIAGGRLQILAAKGIDYLQNNNQINTLGVQINAAGKLQLEVDIINPYNGTQSQQAGLWYGLSDKTFIKLDIYGNKVELRKEFNDVSSVVATNNPDQRVTQAITGLNTKTVRLRMVIDSVAQTAEGFYSTDGGVSYKSSGASGYSSSKINIASMGLTSGLVYAGIYSSYRSGTSAVSYTFDNFSIVNTLQKSLSFSRNVLNFTVLKGTTVIPQAVKLTSSPSTSTYVLTKSEASWLELPQIAADSLRFNSLNVNSDIAVGTYQALITCTANGYPPATLLINLNVIEKKEGTNFKVNFQDAQTVPPFGYYRDYGQSFGSRNGLYQGSNQQYGWKKRSDGSLINITGNGRNRNTPEDLLLATLIHMQANNIAGSFTGSKIESYWEAKVMNGTYDVSVSVGDGTVNTAPESHTINVEGQNVISAFVPSGKQGTISRFKSATIRINVTDELLTINADGGKNTKINYAEIQPVSLAPYLYWSSANQNILIKKGTTESKSFTLTLGNSTNATKTYSIAATYGAGATGWLSFSASQTGVQPTITFNYSTAKNLAVGTYYATLKATSSQYTSAEATIQLSVIDSLKPYVISSSPPNGAMKVDVNTVSIAANNLHVPVVAGFQGGVDNSTITNTTVKLFKLVDTTATPVTGTVQGTGGGDAVSFSPSTSLLPSTKYKFVVTSGVKSYSGLEFSPYEATFITDVAKIDSSAFLYAQFTKIPIPGTQNIKYTSLAIGPDSMFYALRLDGAIERYTINHSDGSLSNKTTINTLIDKYGERSAIGLTFDPASTALAPIAWVSHCSAGLTTAPAFDGNISKLDGPDLSNEQLMITKLPRSTRDHMVNGLAFGPDSALYICQGSNSSAGSFDNDWQRNESLLSGCVLRLNIQKLSTFTLPLNVQTTSNQNLINAAPDSTTVMSDGTYNPYANGSPLTIFASGVRNAFDLVWHSNGQLYLPTNGSGGGGNSPGSITGTRRPDGSFYNGPAIPATTGVKVQDDWLFRVNPAMPIGYFGHPNPLRGEYVINRGYIDNPLYSPAISADVNYRPSYDFGLNHSPDGAIEYKSGAFNNALKNKLLVCRFSGGSDIVVMEPGSLVKTTYSGNDDHIYDIVKVTTGSSNSGLVGMSSFANPLDLVEDVVTGNLYVSEFNWNDNSNLTAQITLLKVQSQPTPPPTLFALSAAPELSENTYTNQKYIVTLSNKGDKALRVKDIKLSGDDASQFKILNIPLPSNSEPLLLSKNSSLTFKVSLPPSALKALSAKLKVTSVDDTVKEVQIDKIPDLDSIQTINKAITNANNFKMEERSLTIYPNPNYGSPVNVRLRNFNKQEPVTIYLYDMMGYVLKSIKAVTDLNGEFHTQISVENMHKSNFYIVRALFSTGSRFAKLIMTK